MMVYKSNFMLTYLKYNFFFFFHFQLRSDPELDPDPHPWYDQITVMLYGAETTVSLAMCEECLL